MTTTNYRTRPRYGAPDGTASAARWITDNIVRYGGPGPDERLLRQPSDVSALVVRLKNRFGTHGLTPAGIAWVQRFIYADTIAERRRMHDALLKAAGLPARVPTQRQSRQEQHAA